MGKLAKNTISILADNWKALLLPFIFLVVSVVGVELLIDGFRRQHIEKTLRGIESLFSDETLIGDFYIYAKRLTELENLGLLTCSKLTELSSEGRVFFDSTYKKGCRTEDLVEREIVSLNRSSKWRLAAEVSDLPYLRLGNWFSRIVFLIIFVMGAQRIIAANRRARLLETESLWLRNLTQQVKHDVASPLSALKIATQFPDLSPNLRDFLTNAVARTAEVFSDLENGHRSQLSRFDLSSLAKTVCEEKSFSNIDLDIEPTEILSSRADLARVISNILNNAIEANPEGRIEIRCKSDGRTAVLSISDQGSGFPELVLTKIKRGLTINKTGGSGLGLFHAQKTMNALGGNLSLRNLTTGAMVSLELPVDPSAALGGDALIPV